MGPYDATTNRYVKDQAYDDGHWYVSEDGNLYLVPNAVAEIEGPDDATLDALNAVYRETEFDEVKPEEVAEKLGLEVVAPALRRFDPVSGYFSA